MGLFNIIWTLQHRLFQSIDLRVTWLNRFSWLTRWLARRTWIAVLILFILLVLFNRNHFLSQLLFSYVACAVLQLFEALPSIRHSNLLSLKSFTTTITYNDFALRNLSWNCISFNFILLRLESKSELRAFTLLRVKRYLTAEAVSNLLANIEAKPVTLRVVLLANWVSWLEERLENVQLVTLCDADALVCHFISHLKFFNLVFDRLCVPT